ncbi:hypothetical protein ABE073_04160 [Lederbergia citrisecunda]|uniref:hypothetical protein n=1 Tax=Lederbergia citrisecunda TaxID=2833583 RepID=UPI003D2C37F2
MYIKLMNERVQNLISRDLIIALSRIGFEGFELFEAVDMGMDSRLNDLSDTIDISKYKEE